MKDIIKPNMLFRDTSGCLLKTIRRAPGTDDWWCTGQPDCIGQWRYSTKNILAGLLPTDDCK
jgi:hypothetical protein